MEKYYGTIMVKRANPNDELKHWKYIKREKKNGKWVYYYDKEQLKDDLGVDEKERLTLKTDAYNDAVTKKKKHRKFIQRSTSACEV